MNNNNRSAHMKNKLIKLLLMIVFVVSFHSVKALDRPNTITPTKLANQDNWVSHIDGGSVNTPENNCTENAFCPLPMATTVNGHTDYVYSYQQLKNAPFNNNTGLVLNNPEVIMSKVNPNVPDFGLIYLLNQARYVNDNNYANYKSVQSAIWLYIYYHRRDINCDNSSTSTGTNACIIFGDGSTPNTNGIYMDANPYYYVTHGTRAIQLYNNAVSKDNAHRNDTATAFSLTQPATYVFDYSGTTLTSKPVTVTATGSNSCTIGISSYSIVDKNGNNLSQTVNPYIIDANGNRITSISDGTVFRVRVDNYNSADQVKTITVNIETGCQTISSYPYRYHSTNTSVQDIIYTRTYGIDTDKPMSFTYTSEVVYYKVNISKVDSKTNTKLAGAHLKLVRKDNNELIEEWTSTNSAHETSRLLAGKTYVITETQAAPEHILNTEPFEFTLNADGTTSPLDLVIINKPYPIIKFRKTDVVSGIELAGATFQIKDRNGQVVNEWTSTTTPKEIAIGPGTYTLEEIKAPENYNRSGEIIPFSVDNNGVPSVTVINMKNKAYPKIQISKKDITTNREIEGARLKLVNTETRKTYEWITTGEPYELQVAPGSYVLTETSAPTGYILNTDEFNFTVSENGNTNPSNLVMYNEQTRDLLLAKTDSETGEYVPDAKLRVRSTDGSFDKTITTSARTVKVEGLVFGDYILTEEEAPDHYDCNREEITIHVTKDSPKEIKIEVPNNPLKKVGISKLDSETRSFVRGATIVVRNALNGEEVKRITSISSEYIVELPYGLYEVEEIEAPLHYKRDSEIKFVFVSNLSPAITKVELLNVPLRRIGLSKIDMETGIKVAGATLVLTNLETNEKHEVISNNTGYSIIEDLDYGTYRVSEKQAPDHYQLNEWYYDLTIDNNSPSETDFEFPDAPLRSVALAKVNKETGEYIPGVTLALKRGDGEVITKVVTREEKVIVEDLYYGIYYVEEENTPTGYEQLTEPIVFVINKRSDMVVDVSVPNKPLRELYLAKVNSETGNYVAGAKLIVRDKDQNQIGSTVTTKNEPIRFSEYLDYGTYYIEELEAPDGYKRKETQQQLIVKEDSPISLTVKIGNVPYRKFVVEKIDSETKQLIAGAKFRVRDENGNVINEFISKTEPTVVNDIYYGDYSIEEVEAPDNYRKHNETKNVTVNARSDLEIKFTFENVPLRKIKVTVFDSETLDNIKGAKFTLTTDKGEKVGDLEATDGYGIINKIDYGTYYLEQTKAPKGYRLNTEKVKIVVNKDSASVIEVEFKNEPLRSLSIANVNSETNRLIKDSVLTLKDSEGNIIETFTTLDERHMIYDLAYGTYYLVQETCPIGYKKNLEGVKIVLDKDSEDIVYVDITNSPLYSIKIVKLGSDNMKSLTGAKFRIWSEDPNNPYDQEFISEKSGLYVDNIPQGTYMIQEIEAPKGYDIIDLVQEFEVTMDGEEVTFNVIDDVPQTGISVYYTLIVIFALFLGYTFIVYGKKSKVSSLS